MKHIEISPESTPAPLSRYNQKRVAFEACRRDLIKWNVRKLQFHFRSLVRAVFNLKQKGNP